MNNDNTFLSGRVESVGHIIKKGALDLEPFLPTLSTSQRRVFTLGMSSILDMYDQSENRQLQRLFTPNEQVELKEMYGGLKTYSPTNTSSMSPELLLHWELCIVKTRR